MTIKRIGELTAYWMDRLKVSHWNVTYAYGTQEDLRAKKGEFLYATILLSPIRDHGKILIFKARDLMTAQKRLGVDLLDGKPLARVYEEAVIHELLHLRMDPREHLAGDSMFETGLDATAETLYEFRYGLCPRQ